MIKTVHINMCLIFGSYGVWVFFKSRECHHVNRASQDSTWHWSSWWVMQLTWWLITCIASFVAT